MTNVPSPDHRFGVALEYLPIELVLAVAEVLQPRSTGGVRFDLRSDLGARSKFTTVTCGCVNLFWV